METKHLIQTIIDEILSDKDISSIFLKLQVLVHKLKNEQLTEWFLSERSGYAKDKILPDYRIIYAVVYGKVEQNRGFAGSLYHSKLKLPISHLDKEIKYLFSYYECRDSLNVIENLSKQEDGELAVNIPDSSIPFLQRGLERNCFIHQVWQEIQKHDLSNIIKQTKASLLQFLLEINDNLNLDLNFNDMENKEKVNQAINNTIYAGVVTMGDSSTVNANNSAIQGGTNNTFRFNNSIKEQTKEIVKQIEELHDSLGENQEEILSELTRIKVQLKKNEPKTNIITSALQTIQGILIGVTGNQATPYVVEGIGNLLKLFGA